MNMELKTTVIDFGNGIYAIDQQMVRAFLIVGSRKALLLDTGAVKADILSYINDITSLPVEVILTHGDGDHIGNLAAFNDAFVNENDMAAVLSHTDCMNVSLHSLENGEEFDIGGRKLEVLLTPGHTAGSLCLLDRENKILFSGDTVSYGPVFMFGARRNMAAYLESLRLLQKMKNDGIYETVYCCHNVCPVPADTVDDLVSCVQGIRDGTIAGIPADMPVPGRERPDICRYGSCALLIEHKTTPEGGTK